MVSRYNKLRDDFLDFCHRACLGPRLEMGCGAGYTNTHNPTLQMFLSLTGTLANLLPLTLSVTSTLHPSVLLEVSMTAGSAALVAENRSINIMTGSVWNWVGCASHLWTRPMGVGVLQQWRPFLSSLVAFPPG